MVCRVIIYVFNVNLDFKDTIPAIHGAKTTKNQTPLLRFARLFYSQTVFLKSVWHFFDQEAIDAKNV